MEIDNNIDWFRVAKPQNNGYDSEIALSFAERSGYSRGKYDHLHFRLDGALSVRSMEYPNEVSMWCEQGPLDHPNIDRSIQLLKCWDDGFEQFKLLIDTIYPIQNVKISRAAFPNSGDHSSNIILGSSSHSEWIRFGSLYTTISDPIGTAQAFVHEMAHQKLRALGVHVEKANRFINNGPDALFESPVRKDKLRPMSAIVHATYSWIYIVQLDIKMLEYQKRNNPDEVVMNLFYQYIYRNLPPLTKGMEIIYKNIILDSDGKEFFSGFYNWYNEIIDEINEFYCSDPDKNVITTSEVY